MLGPAQFQNSKQLKRTVSNIVLNGCYKRNCFLRCFCLILFSLNRYTEKRTYTYGVFEFQLIRYSRFFLICIMISMKQSWLLWVKGSIPSNDSKYDCSLWNQTTDDNGNYAFPVVPLYLLFSLLYLNKRDELFLSWNTDVHQEPITIWSNQNSFTD